MSKYSIEDTTLTGIADAVRHLRYEEEPMTPAEIEAKIRDSDIGLNLDVCAGDDEPWVRPDDWPDLDEIEMDDDFDGVYLTYDLRKTPGYGWIGISFYTELRPSDAVYIERGHLENNIFVVDESHYVASDTAFRQKLDEENGLVQLWRVRSDSHIQRFYFRSSSSDNTKSISYLAQPCVEATGRLPYIIRIVSDSVSINTNYMGYVTMWLERDSRACGGKGICTVLQSAWRNAISLRSLDVSKWDTSNWKVTSMESMFYDCKSLTSVNLNHWDTSKWAVGSMLNMFYQCRSLKSVDISEWDTSNWTVTNISGMFYLCISLTEIRLGKWDTSNWKIATMSGMFSNCYSILSNDIGKWNTTNWEVANLNDTFRENNSLINLDISEWDTSNWKVTTMYMTFAGCLSLKKIDISNWDTSKWSVTNMNSTFSNCQKLECIDLNNWDTSKWAVTTMASLFNGCYSLCEIRLGKWDTSNWKVTDMSSMCNNCRCLKIFDFDEWNTSNWNVTTIQALFSACWSLKKIDLTRWDTHNWPLNGIRSTFDGCRNVRSIDVRGWDTSKFSFPINALGYFFSNLNRIESVKGFESWDFTNVTNAGNIPDSHTFIECTGMPIVYNHSYTNCIRLKRESLINILTSLPTVSGKTITLGDHNKRKLTAEEIAIAENKGWTVA